MLRLIDDRETLYISYLFNKLSNEFSEINSRRVLFLIAHNLKIADFFVEKKLKAF